METTKRVWVAATLDTKSDEAFYVSKLLEAAGVSVALADLSTSGSSFIATSRIHFSAEDIAAYHRQVRANGVAVPDLDTTFYGMMEFRLDDPDGNRLWIGQRS